MGGPCPCLNLLFCSWWRSTNCRGIASPLSLAPKLSWSPRLVGCMPISLRPWVSVMPTTASINGGEARRAAFVGTTLRAFVETGLPDLPAPSHLRAADAQTLFECLRDHQWELGASIDLHTATVCAGSTGAVDILVVDTVGRFTEYGEDALQRLTAGSTRPTGPLLVASPTHRWGILAAMELHASLYGTMVSYEDLSSVVWSALWSGSAAPSGSCDCARVL